MFYLYTSALNPKGVQVQQFLNKKSVQYKEITIYGKEKTEIRIRAEKLVQIFLERTSEPLSLPFLTRMEEGEERIVLLGFVPTEWEQFFSLQVANVPVNPAGITTVEGMHVPVVGAEEKPLQ